MTVASVQAEFPHGGYLILRGAMPAQDCARLRDVVWRALTGAHGMHPDDPGSWRSGMVLRIARRMAPDALGAVNTPRVNAAVDALLGPETWEPPRVRAQALPNFPRPAPWVLPGRGWHLDFPVRPNQRHPFAVKLLCLLAPVAAHGGGTLLLKGSHRLVAALAERGFSGRSSDVRRRLARQYPWLAALFAGDHSAAEARAFMDRTEEIDGVPLRVVEFTGDAGDVLLFHPWLLHNISPNASATPRLQIGQTLLTRDGRSVYTPPMSDPPVAGVPM